MCIVVNAGCARKDLPRTGVESPFVLSGLQNPAEREFIGADGRTLGFFHYAPEANSDKNVSLIYLHGIESHAGWFDLVARKLARDGYTLYMLDRRGSGINRENRGFRSGDTPSYQLLLADIHAFMRQVPSSDHQTVMVGLSWGGKLATAYVLGNPKSADALILITPGLKPKVDMTPWEKALLVGAVPTSPESRFHIPIDIPMFTTDPQWQERIRRDPLRLHSATARFFWESRKLDRFIERRIGRNALPVLLFLAGRDKIVDNSATIRLLERGHHSLLTVETYTDETHSLQFEAPHRVASDMRNWMETVLKEGRP